MTISRRDFLALIAALAAGRGVASDMFKSGPIATRHVPRVIITTDFTVNPHWDPDDFYDVACGKALGVYGVVLDFPKLESVVALQEIGVRALPAKALRDADSVVVIGSPTHAAQQYRPGQRIILHAGDVQGFGEANAQADPAAYEYLRPRSRWVPCFDGGIWQNPTGRASYVQTTDATLRDGLPVDCWFDKYVSDVYGLRNLWVGPLLRFGWQDTWRGHSVASGVFQAGAGFRDDMVSGTRELLTRAVNVCPIVTTTA